MLKVLKAVRSLFTSKHFGEYCYLYQNNIYGFSKCFKIRIKTDIGFNCAVKMKDLITILDKIKTSYVAVQENNKIIFKDENGVEYILDDARPINFDSITFPEDFVEPLPFTVGTVFTNILSAGDMFAKKSGDHLKTDSILVSGKTVSVSDRKTILQGVESEPLGRFSIHADVIPLLQKLLKFDPIQRAIQDDEMQLDYDGDFSAWFPINQSDVIDNATSIMQNVFIQQGMKDFFELTNEMRVNLNRLYQNYKTETMILTESNIICGNVEITHGVVHNPFSIKIKSDFAFLLIKFAKYVCVKDGYIGFVNSENNLYGITGGIIDD